MVEGEKENDLQGRIGQDTILHVWGEGDCLPGLWIYLVEENETISQGR